MATNSCKLFYCHRRHAWVFNLCCLHKFSHYNPINWNKLIGSHVVVVTVLQPCCGRVKNKVMTSGTQSVASAGAFTSWHLYWCLRFKMKTKDRSVLHFVQRWSTTWLGNTTETAISCKSVLTKQCWMDPEWQHKGMELQYNESTIKGLTQYHWVFYQNKSGLIFSIMQLGAMVEETFKHLTFFEKSSSSSTANGTWRTKKERN